MDFLAAEIGQAVSWLADADGLLITAGAGMGVDSGLPDFRGAAGFWKAYPALGAQNIGFQDIANGMAFQANPRRSWGFYGHRLDLYRNTVPHEGFHILQQLASHMAHGTFVFTSNVDGQFQKAGFSEERIVECHGSIHHLQCLEACTGDIWPATDLVVKVDIERCAYVGPLPACPHCGGYARPNILMFNDWSWLATRTLQQETRLKTWLAAVKNPVIIELGAGTAVSTVRQRSERLQASLIRINPDDSTVRSVNAVGIPMGALDALRAIRTHFDLVK